jgi:hypothetical protein
MRALLTLPTSLDPPANGAFEIDNVPHGRYNLFATIHDPGSSIRGETGPVSVGRIPISIEGFELGFLSINVLRGVAVNGRVTQNGRPLSNGVALMLEPDMSVAGMLPYQDVARVRPMIAPDGAFTFPQVPEGHYNVRAGIAGQPTASVRVIHDGKDITDSGLDVGDTPPLPIEIEFR